MTLDLTTVIGKTLNMYDGTTLYQSGTVESINGTTVKINRESLQSPITDLSTHIYNTYVYAKAYWYASGYIDKLTSCTSQDIFSAVQTRSVWISCDYDYKIYVMDEFGVFGIMPINYLLAYWDGSAIPPSITINFRLPDGRYFTITIATGILTDFSGSFSGMCTADFLGNLYDTSYQYHAVFKTSDADIRPDRPRRSIDPYDVYSELTITNIQFFNCNKEPISDGEKCLITNRSFSGTFT